MSDLPPILPEDVAEIVAILDGTDYERLDISTGRLRLRVARSGGGWTQEWTHDEDAAAAAVSVVVVPAVAAEPENSPAVRSPLPGVFYRAPKPGASPFIDVGDRVEPDTVVGIIETMKVMNSVAAGIAGTVAEIVVEDGQQVDIDMLLIRIAV